ncbi:MAG: hypothetical protein MI976_18825 [Pseudomonadales bacterium]|nr:hypothetical protein [Pseudomonadales bacterium]
MIEKTYKYRVRKPFLSIVIILMSYVFTNFVIDKLQSPESIISIKGISIGEPYSLIVLGFSLLICLALGVMGFGLFVLSFVNRSFKVNDTGLITPRTLLSREIVELNFNDIKHYEIQTIRKNDILLIKTKNGDIRIPSNAFDNKLIFGSVLESISKRKFIDPKWLTKGSK